MEPFLGEIKLFAGTFAPADWHFCDGTLLPISTNDALYSLIGTTYGGDGVTTFGIPDLRGRVPVHAGQGAGLSAYQPGEAGGQEQVSLLTVNLPKHTHQLMASTVLGAGADPTNNVIAQAAAGCNVFVKRAANTAYSGSHMAASGGNGQPHENRQAYVAINYIIALAGVFPSQS